ncbi:DUF6247 family protein [Nocardiopsis chromatogenes]|uniref:DUF6247 family protein n=1 Tax=Nocardiopsis chromatogenes TaxID=280239 RepID=UPI000347AE3D|nr:DUF6247 family protein [Nocardiopsis chromatogenes]
MGEPLFDEPGRALIEQPPPNVAALRAAVAQIAPSRLPEFHSHLAEATTNAESTGSLAPIRAFTHHWSTVVAITRFPERESRLRELEAVVDSGSPDSRAAIKEIQALLAQAETDAGL